jgi:hypothetical protein
MGPGPTVESAFQVLRAHSDVSWTRPSSDLGTNPQYIRGDSYGGRHLGSYTQDGKQLSMPRRASLAWPVASAEIASRSAPGVNMLPDVYGSSEVL